MSDDARTWNPEDGWPMPPADTQPVTGVVEIDMDEYMAALNDPKVHQLHADARAYAESLIAQGHCRCHLVMSCPDKDRP